jgi:hypothetical protein
MRAIPLGFLPGGRDQLYGLIDFGFGEFFAIVAIRTCRSTAERTA